VDVGARGIDVDSPTNADVGPRGIHADSRTNADISGRGINVDPWATRVPAPPARIGHLRRQQRQGDQRQKRQRNPFDKPFHRSFSLELVKKWDWLRAETMFFPAIHVTARCLSQFFHKLSDD